MNLARCNMYARAGHNFLSSMQITSTEPNNYYKTKIVKGGFKPCKTATTSLRAAIAIIKAYY